MQGVVYQELKTNPIRPVAVSKNWFGDGYAELPTDCGLDKVEYFHSDLEEETAARISSWLSEKWAVLHST